MSVVGDDGKIHLKSRGDSNFLAKQFVEEDPADGPVIQGGTLRCDYGENILSSAFDSSIVADEVFAELAGRPSEEPLDTGPEDFAIVKADPATGRLVTEDEGGVLSSLDHSAGDYLDKTERVPDPVPVRLSTRVGKGVNKLYEGFVRNSYSALRALLLYVGSLIVLSCKSPDVEPIMSYNVKVSHDEYLWKNPTWGQAKKRSDSSKWSAADDKERQQHMSGDKATFRWIQGRRPVLPRDAKVLPLKRVCTIKDDGSYKVRWVVLGNLDNFAGDTYAPTTAKKVIWLLYAVGIILGLTRRFFDIKGAFMSEKLERVVYVTIDGQYYELMYSLYGLPEAARLFNLGLVAHLKAGGYVQSKWDQCLFIKWTSATSFIFIGLHVDDFNANATSKQELDHLGAYLRTKYEVTQNCDGIYLGTRCTEQPDGSQVFTKPFMLQALFDKFLPEGPIRSLPPHPVSETYLRNFEANDVPCDNNMFRSLLGGLQQLLDVRPELAFGLSKIGQRTDKSRAKDLEALVYALHYLYGTRDKGLLLRPGFSSAGAIAVRMRAYADCGFASNGNGRSQYCICFDLVPESEHDEEHPIKRLHRTGMFYFKSWMAPTTDLNTSEGEMGTVIEATKDSIFFNGILDEMHLPQLEPTPIYNDNKSSITLATQFSGNHKRIRYMLPRVNWLIEKVKEQVIRLLYLNTRDLPADLGTKGLTGTPFIEHRDGVLGF